MYQHEAKLSMIVFKNIEQDIIRFSTEERLEGVTVRVVGLYSPSDDHTLVPYWNGYSSYFESIDPSLIYFISHCSFVGFPFLKLIFEKDKENLSEILIPADDKWSLPNFFSNSELKEINKCDLSPYCEIFLDGEYGGAVEIPNLNTIVDLGFNCGWFALFSADKAQKYIAVEADDRLNSTGLLINKKNKNKIEICNRVFHDTNDEDITFHLSAMNHSGSNSIWDKLFDDDNLNTIKEPTLKKTINLPEIIKRYNLDYIDLLKVDIEGAEEFLLKKPNLETVLNKVGTLLIELHGEDIGKAFDDNIEIRKCFYKEPFDKFTCRQSNRRQSHPSRGKSIGMQTIKLTKKPELNILQCINTKQN